MKKSELRHIIKEELLKELKGTDYDIIGIFPGESVKNAYMFYYKLPDNSVWFIKGHGKFPTKITDSLQDFTNKVKSNKIKAELVKNVKPAFNYLHPYWKFESIKLKELYKQPLVEDRFSINAIIAQDIKLSAEIDKLMNSKDKLTNKYNDLVPKYNSQLKDIESERKQLLLDMEQEVGNASESEKDKIGNQYGAKLNKLDSKIDKLDTTIGLSKTEKQIDDIDKELSLLRAKRKGFADTYKKNS